MKGKLIIFEGVEKCGKSMQLERLAGYLLGKGYGVVTTKEPGGGIPDLRQKIFDLSPNDPDLPEKELELFERDRYAHFDKVIIPAYERGEIILCDRSYPSTESFQGYGRGMDLNRIRAGIKRATQGIEADLIILLDISPEEILQRIKKDDATRVTRFEKEPREFHERVRQGFLAQAKENPAKWLVLDGTRTRNEITLEIQKAIRERLGL